MFNNIFKFFSILLLLYQTPLYSKNPSLNNFKPKDLSNYFSGIVAFENKDNSEALKFFNSSKILLNKHDFFLKRYITTLVLEKKVPQAINVVKSNRGNKNTNFFDAYLLLILDSLKKNNINQANIYLNDALNFDRQEQFNSVILKILKEYLFVFKEKKLLLNNKNFGNLSFIAETFQRCYLEDKKTGNYFFNLINKNEADYTRYIYFYLSHLVQNNNLIEAKKILSEIDYINSTLLLSQGKSWFENKNYKKFKEVFSCQNHNHIISEFLFLISNLYSAQNDFEKSNYYLFLSNYSNPKFLYNLSLVAENYYFNNDYIRSKKILKNFNEEDKFYFWYRKKKEAQIISKLKNKKESVKYLSLEFDKISNPNNKMIFDLANFYKNSKDYKIAISYYTKLIEFYKDSPEIKSDLLYRRGSSYERRGDYQNADKDLLDSLNMNPDDAYALNYLAYSWLERNYKIEEAIKMLETAYASKSDDPYIIDSIGWAYYLINDYKKAEKLMIRAVQLMPDDPIVNDHYGDILWKLDQKIQARYFWKNVLEMDELETEMKKKINNKLLKGL